MLRSPSGRPRRPPLSPGRCLLLVVLLVGTTVGCQSDSSSDPDRPAWMEGVWSGRLAYEHDTTSHRLRLDLDAERFTYPASNCAGTLSVDSTGAQFVRMRLVAGPDSLHCGDVVGGIAELRRLDDVEGLHLQYWPRGTVNLYLAQLRRQP